MILYRATDRLFLGTGGCFGTLVVLAVGVIAVGVAVYVTAAVLVAVAAWALVWTLPRALWGARAPRGVVVAVLASWYLVLSFAVVILIGALP